MPAHTETKAPKAKTMELRVERYIHQKEETFGKFYINGEYQCYTLEDQKRDEKVMGDTRIDAGRYQVVFRKEGGHHAKYLAKYGAAFHRGMLHVLNVPKFKFILIHVGNTELDTMGCLIVGLGKTKNSLTQSIAAYQKIYPPIAAALEKGEEVWITYIDIYPN
jgi:hypothetical protein